MAALRRGRVKTQDFRLSSLKTGFRRALTRSWGRVNSGVQNERDDRGHGPEFSHSLRTKLPFGPRAARTASWPKADLCRDHRCRNAISPRLTLSNGVSFRHVQRWICPTSRPFLTCLQVHLPTYEGCSSPFIPTCFSINHRTLTKSDSRPLKMPY
jgi:hypothetical protein